MLIWILLLSLTMKNAKKYSWTPTKFIKVCINAIWSSHGTNKTSFQEGAPSIHQHSLSSLVVLRDEGRCRSWLHCQYFSFGSPEMLLQYLHSHRTDSSNSSMNSLIHSFCTHLSLSEEEVNLVIITIIVVRNNCWPNKFRFCKKLKTVRK